MRPSKIGPFLLLLCLGAGTGARADPFAWELSGAESQTDLDPVYGLDDSTIGATYYFDHVDDSRGPLALATFLDPETRVGASFVRERQTLHMLSVAGAPALPDDVTDSETYAVSGRYVLPAKNWYAGAQYSQTDLGTPRILMGTDADMHGATMFAGRYVGPETTLELALNRDVTDAQGTGVICVLNEYCASIVPQSTRQTEDTATLSAQHVQHFGSWTYSLSGSVSDTSGELAIHSASFQLPVFSPVLPSGVVFQGGVPYVTVPASTVKIGLDRFLVYGLAGEVFPTRKLGVRLGYTHWDDADLLDYAYDVAASWFVTRKVDLRFAFGRQRAHSFADFRETDVASLQATGRF
jgi:hypothetical protein